MNAKIAAALVSGVGTAACLANNLLSVSHYCLSFPDLPQEFDGFSIVQISDLHNKKFGCRQERLLRRIRSLSPDVVCITGDLIDKRRTTAADWHHALNLCAGLVGEVPVLYVPGNHEAKFFPYKEWKRILMAMGVTVLENRRICLEHGEGKVVFAGLCDPDFTFENQPAFQNEIFRQCRGCEDTFTVLLSHRPEAIADYGAAGPQLVLTGHAHGGQFRIPGVGPLWAPHQGILPQYAQGVHRFGRTEMVVSRGLGNSLFPQRVLNHPEIVHLTLQRSKI